MWPPSSRSYPRGLPFLPPDDGALQETRLHRWTLLLISGIAVTALVLAATALFVANRPVRHADPSSPTPIVLRGWVYDLPQALPAQPEQPPPAPARPPDPAPDSGKQVDRLAEVLGGMSAAQLYHAYLNIGLLADSAENRIYTTAEARKLLDAVMSLLSTTDSQLALVGGQDLKPPAQQSLERARQLIALLRTQVNALGAYWETRDREQLLRFHRSREEAWSSIKELLD